MAKKIMNDFNINDNEEVDRILNIFHGNSTVLHNLPKTKQQNGMNETSEKRPMYPETADSAENVPLEPVEDSQYPTTEDLPTYPTTEDLPTYPTTEDLPTYPTTEDLPADDQARKMTMGGMNMLEETMEILNKFHGGSINYEKF